MAKANLPKRLFKSADRISSYHDTLRSSGKLMKRMARDHLDLLQNIEFVLARRHREDQDIDDRIALAAIRASLENALPDDPVEGSLVEELREICDRRPEISDELRRDAFRVIADSVTNHSQLRPGEKSYLAFIQRFTR
jgi:hypothetical protein